MAVDNTSTMAAEPNMLIALLDSASEKLKSYRKETCDIVLELKD